MTRENRKWKRFRKNISRHICSRYPGSRKRAIENMVTNKMVPYINVLGMSRDSRRVGEGTRGLVITEDRERAGDWKF